MQILTEVKNEPVAQTDDLVSQTASKDVNKEENTPTVPLDASENNQNEEEKNKNGNKRSWLIHFIMFIYFNKVYTHG